MSHSWNAEIRTIGLIDAADESAALTVRNAHLALLHSVATPEDSSSWTSIVSTLNTLLTAIDPAHTGLSTIRIHASGFHAGFSAASLSFNLSYAQPGVELADPHHITFDTVAALSAPEVALTNTYVNAVLAARGQTATPSDDIAYTALLAAGQSLVLLLEPGALGDVRTSVSVLVDLGLTAAELSLSISSTQPIPDSSLPSGAVIAFRGLAIPNGWLLCDGNNGTPDLRGRFIVGDTIPGIGSALGTSDPTAALSHSVTQPVAHSVTQPAAHSVTQPAAHSNHAVTQPAAHSNHAVTQPAAHATAATATTGTGLRFSAAAAAQHSGTAVDAHSAHTSTAVDAHSAHAGTAVSVHSGASVDAHTGTAVTSHPTLAHYRLVYIIKQ